MKTLITNVVFDNCKKDILLIDGKLEKVNQNIDDVVDVKIDGKDLYAMKGLTNCYFNGEQKDCDKLLSQGITTIFDFSNDVEITKKLVGLGFRVCCAVGDFDGNTILNEKYLDDKINEVVGLGVSQAVLFVINPNVADESQYNEIIQYGKKHNILIATSASENLEDVGEIDKQYGMSPIALLESYGFLDFKHMLIDCVCIDKDDVNILTNYDTTICVCPTKNLKSGSGVAPVYSLIKNNLNIVIGGVNNSIFQELDLCKNLQSGYLNEANILSDKDVIDMGIDNVNCLLINKVDRDNLDIVLVDESNILECTPLNVRLTIINGRVVYNKLNE